MEFLYDPHRLNVATSPAPAMAAIVTNPDLVRVSCRTPRQMPLANTLCTAGTRTNDFSRAAATPGPRPAFAGILILLDSTTTHSSGPESTFETLPTTRSMPRSSGYRTWTAFH